MPTISAKNICNKENSHAACSEFASTTCFWTTANPTEIARHKNVSNFEAESKSKILKRSLESWKAGVGENRTPVLERVVGMKSCVLHLQQEEICMDQFKSWSISYHFRVRSKYLRCTSISFRKLLQCSLKRTQVLFSEVLFWHCFDLYWKAGVIRKIKIGIPIWVRSHKNI